MKYAFFTSLDEIIGISIPKIWISSCLWNTEINIFSFVSPDQMPSVLNYIANAEYCLSYQDNTFILYKRAAFHQSLHYLLIVGEPR